MASSTVSQISCFSSINRTLHLQRRSILPCPTLRLKLGIVMSLEGRSIKTSSLDDKTTLNYASGTSNPHIEGIAKPHPSIEENVAEETEISEPVQEYDVAQQKKGAKIHDFCFGIPFGGFVLTGGLIGFIFSRNPTTLGTGVLFGGALLALSTFSMKIWRQGKSSLPFILGQAVLSAALVWKNLQAYTLTKKVFPTGFYVVISAAMLCFYSYVMASGGNPPPKKLKASASVSP